MISLNAELGSEAYNWCLGSAPAHHWQRELAPRSGICVTSWARKLPSAKVILLKKRQLWDISSNSHSSWWMDAQARKSVPYNWQANLVIHSASISQHGFFNAVLFSHMQQFRSDENFISVRKPSPPLTPPSRYLLALIVEQKSSWKSLRKWLLIRKWLYKRLWPYDHIISIWIYQVFMNLEIHVIQT